MRKTNRDRIEELILSGLRSIEEVPVASPLSPLATYLSENGVIAAPVKIGQEVYAGLSGVFEDEEDEIYPWTVKGIGIDNEGRYIAFNDNGEIYVVGDVCCRLTKAEAAADIMAFNLEYKK